MNRKQISVLLLLLFFVFYAVSPVLYTMKEQQTGQSGTAPETAGSSPSSVYIFFLSMVLSRLSDNPDQENTSASRFLLKKAKAVLKSLIDIRQVQSEFSILPPAVSLGSPVFFVKYASETSPKPNNNSLSFFSGLSPPAAYQLLK
jgi:hypothetical protein